ncbi:TetR/AcrR family transcriptional regulator [Bacillus sp. 31A1R]|uniref:TetR/AcrR family transcriptional regulator n=1 Tax=Robertmurraya mangrovi TaxID=3098077 RepID=A0ABU5J0Y3_9BACI|nr:TetR/AcrR family transcriptional regulator [Bacillus sp. 31A1R]MDZ5473027.1 TetR/AcrR family transcriptional regulator [Bacillus sp. 31A1R]
MRHKRRDGIETRHLIVKVSRDLFMELGYRAVSTRKIATACQITQPTLYHYFENKEAIYLEVLRTELLETKNQLDQVISNHEDLEECLFQISYHLLLHVPKDLSQMEHDIRHELAEQHRGMIFQWWQAAYLTPISTVLEKGMNKGEIRHPSEYHTTVDSLSMLLLNLIKAYPPSDPSSPEIQIEKRAEEQARLFTNILLYGLAPK